MISISLNAQPYPIDMKWTRSPVSGFTSGAQFTIDNYDFVTSEDKEFVNFKCHDGDLMPGYKYAREWICRETVEFLAPNNLYYLTKLNKENLPGNSYIYIMEIINANNNQSKVIKTRLMNNDSAAKVIDVTQEIGSVEDGFRYADDCSPMDAGYCARYPYYVEALFVTITLEDGQKITKYFHKVDGQLPQVDILPGDIIYLTESSGHFTNVNYKVRIERNQLEFNDFNGMARKDRNVAK